jgi:hypothetical protein
MLRPLLFNFTDRIGFMMLLLVGAKLEGAGGSGCSDAYRKRLFFYLTPIIIQSIHRIWIINRKLK